MGVVLGGEQWSVVGGGGGGGGKGWVGVGSKQN